MTTQTVVEMARKAGCVATKPKNIARWVRGNSDRMAEVRRLQTQQVRRWRKWSPVLTAEVPDYRTMDPRWSVTSLSDPAAAVAANDAAVALYPRRKNWRRAVPTRQPSISPWVRTVDLGRYSSRCTYTHYEYEPVYHSAVAVSRSGQCAVLLAAGVVERIILAPAGLRFATDDNGAHVLDAHGTDYHPTAEEWRSRRFAAEVRAQLRVIRASRIQAEREAKRTQAAQKRIDALGPVWVCYEDSIAAGNCRQGTLEFAQRHGLSGHIRADVLARIGSDRAEAAVQAAKVRAAREIIQGYSELAYHHAI